MEAGRESIPLFLTPQPTAAAFPLGNEGGERQSHNSERRQQQQKQVLSPQVVLSPLSTIGLGGRNTAAQAGAGMDVKGGGRDASACRGCEIMGHASQKETNKQTNNAHLRRFPPRDGVLSDTREGGVGGGEGDGIVAYNTTAGCWFRLYTACTYFINIRLSMGRVKSCFCPARNPIMPSPDVKIFGLLTKVEFSGREARAKHWTDGFLPMPFHAR